MDQQKSDFIRALVDNMRWNGKSDDEIAAVLAAVLPKL